MSGKDEIIGAAHFLCDVIVATLSPAPILELALWLADAGPGTAVPSPSRPQPGRTRATDIPEHAEATDGLLFVHRTLRKLVRFIPDRD